MKNAGNVNVSSEEEVVWFTVSLGKTKRGERQVRVVSLECTGSTLLLSIAQT